MSLSLSLTLSLEQLIIITEKCTVTIDLIVFKTKLRKSVNVAVIWIYSFSRKVSFPWCYAVPVTASENLPFRYTTVAMTRETNFHTCITRSILSLCRRGGLTRTDFWCIPSEMKRVNLDGCERLNKRRQCARVVRTVCGLCVLCVAMYIQSVLMYVWLLAVKCCCQLGGIAGLYYTLYNHFCVRLSYFTSSPFDLQLYLMKEKQIKPVF